MIRRPPRSTLDRSSAASDVYKRQLKTKIMAETKPTATASVKATSVQAKKSSNAISWLAPIICLIAGYLIWRFILGDKDGFNQPDNSGAMFWPKHDKPKGALSGIYMGGIIIPVLIGMFLMVVTFSIERFLTISKALGSGSVADFIRKVQYHLANRNVDAAMAECDKQRGSVANVMRAGLRRYKEMTSNNELNTDQKVIAIQKEVEEATALELPMLQKNLVFLSTITSVGTLVAVSYT